MRQLYRFLWLLPLVGGIYGGWYSAYGENLPPYTGLPAGPGSSQEQYQRYQSHQNQLNALPPPSSDLRMKQSNQSSEESQTCFIINIIDVEKARLLSRHDIYQVTRPFLNQCLGSSNINTIVKQLNNLYMMKGYITSRAYLPQQSLREGRLRIIILEGKVEAITIKGRSKRWVSFMAFPGMRERILNLRDLEQGVEQMNRLPHWGASMQIQPGRQPGTSDVVISAPKRGFFHGRAWLDNYGQRVTGRLTSHAAVSSENLLGLLDLWSVEYDHSLAERRNGSTRGTSFFSVNGSIPFGYWTLFGSWYRSQDHYSLSSMADIYRLNGTQIDWVLGLSRVFIRNNIGVLTLQTSFERKSFNSEINHTTIDTQTARQSFVSSQLSASLNVLGSVWYVTPGVRIAIDGAGTWSHFGHPRRDEPHRAYLKPVLDVDGYIPLVRNILWHTTAHAEVSSKSQFPTNQLQIGGPYSVRGFLQNILLGNEGVYVRNDITWTPLQKSLKLGQIQPAFNQLFRGMQFYVALDAGTVRDQYVSSSVPPALKGGTMVGGGMGFRKMGGPLFWDIAVTHSFYSKPLHSEGIVTLFHVGVTM